MKMIMLLSMLELEEFIASTELNFLKELLEDNYKVPPSNRIPCAIDMSIELIADIALDTWR